MIAVWRWTDSTWQQVHSASQSTTETTRANLVPAGAAAGYVGRRRGAGARALHDDRRDFFASGELLQVTYEAP